MKDVKNHEKQKNEKANCPEQSHCLFLKKYSEIDRFRMMGYQKNYCDGPFPERCARLRLFKENRVEPPEDISPTGIDLAHDAKYNKRPVREKDMATRILIFGDDDNSRNLYSFFLRSKGYEVLNFPSPATCALVIEKKCSCPRNYVCADMILASMDMEGMTGLELFRCQKELGCHSLPQNKAILSTGLNAIQKKELAALGCKFLQQPFQLQDLLAWVSACEKNISPDRKLSSYKELLETAQAS